MSHNTQFQDTKWRSPLVNQLFDERFRTVYQGYPAVRNLISTLRSQQNIETFFQKEWENISVSHQVDLLRNHINIQYYLCELFHCISENNRYHEANLYDALFKQLKTYLDERESKGINERIVVVNFNYDTFIEQALERTWGLTFKNIDDYIGYDSSIDLFKPHGSCNWGWPFVREIPSDNIPDWLYENKTTLDQIYFDLLGPEDKMVRSGFGQNLLNKGKIQIVQNKQPFYPALFIPYVDKDDFIMPFHHFTWLQSDLEKVTDIYIIGWKGNEANFNGILKKRFGDKQVNVHIADPFHQEVQKSLIKIFPKAIWTESADFENFCEKYIFQPV